MMSLNEWEKRFREYVSTVVAADDGHDIEHIGRVVKTAKALAEQEQAEMAVVIPAAWLHDCVAVAKNAAQRSQASRLAAEQAIRLLEQWQYPKQHLQAIAHAIEAHSYSANIPCRSLEAKIVQDADRMDALGAIGLVRALWVGQNLANPLLYHNDPFCKQRTANDNHSVIDHFYTKLLKLKDSFHTEAAKKEAQKRHHFMLSFLQQLEREVAN